MEFSRNKFTKWLLIIAGVLLVVGAGIYIYATKFSADEANADFLADWQDPPNLNDPTLIRLPEKYSKEDIKSAVTKSSSRDSKVVTSPKEKEILDYIDAKTKEIAKSIPVQQGTKDKPVMSDLIFTVADSNGQIVYPTVSKDKSTIKSVQDNFVFDSSVPEDWKQIFFDAYPQIEAVYYQRSNTDPIKVFYDPNLQRAYYISWDNSIHLGASFWGSYKDAAIHELVHAFHRFYCYNNLWEEGFAAEITFLIEKKMFGFTDNYLAIEGYRQSIENLPSVYDQDIYNAWAPWWPNLPYQFGSATLDKIYLEDQNFFIKFNQKLYTIDLTKEYLTMSKMIKIATNSVATIEGEDSWVWFSHQYPYTLFYNPTGQEMYFTSLGPGYFGGEDGLSPLMHQNKDYFNLIIRTTYWLDSSDFNVRVLDQQNNELISSDLFTTTSKDHYQVNKRGENLPQKYKDYKGVIKVEITPTTNPNNKKIQSFLKTNNEWNMGDVYVYSKSGAKAVFSSKGSADTATVAKTDGYFALKADWIHKAGRYKVEIYDSKNNKIDEKYFNKAEMSDYYLSLGDENICKDTVSNLKPLNRSFSLTSATKIDCGQVISLNRIPLFRYWGNNFLPTVPNLARDRNYRYQISTASDFSKSSLIARTVKTLSGSDFKLSKVENFGNPADNNFYQKITFNTPYDPKSVNLKIYMTNMMGGQEFSTIIKKVGSNSFEVRADQNLYNNSLYYLLGLDKVTDKAGNPIHKFDYHAAIFNVPLNPPDGEQPAYKLNKDSYAPAENIIVSMNFTSTDLLNKLNEIYISSSQPKPDCDNVDNPSCYQLKVKARFADGKLIIKLNEPLPSAGTEGGGEIRYYLQIPSVVDSKNNYVGRSSLPLVFVQ